MMPGVLPFPPAAGVYHPDRTYLASLQALVENAAAYGIYTLLEFHQDSLSEYFCGEGLPRWMAYELRRSFPQHFEDQCVKLIGRLSPHVPALSEIEEDTVRRLARNRINSSFFPAPLEAPYARLPGQGPHYGPVYTKEQCRLAYWEYQLTFEGGHAAQQLFDTGSAAFQHIQAYWRILAEAFRGNPNVLAFEFFNEPFPGGPTMEPWILLPFYAAPRLERFYQNLAEMVHSIDQGRLVAFSPQTWEEGDRTVEQLNQMADTVCRWLRSVLTHDELEGCETFWALSSWLPADGIDRTAFKAAPLANRSILTFHFYSPPEMNIEVYARKRRRDAQMLHVYPLLTETCCPGPELYKKLFWFESGGLDWITWEYKHQSNATYGAAITGTGPSFFNEDGTPSLEQWRSVAHPSAQHVRGQILANVLRVDYGVFNLTFLPTAAPCDGTDLDAVIVWPHTWWHGSAEWPNITLKPRGAARVSRLPRSISPHVASFGVHVLDRSTAITVILAADFWRRPLPSPGPSEPPSMTLAPWWGGLGWPLLVVLALLVLVYACARCCCWCCRQRRSCRCQRAFVRSPRGARLLG
jgi:endoglycosylceramidase